MHAKYFSSAITIIISIITLNISGAVFAGVSNDMLQHELDERIEKTNLVGAAIIVMQDGEIIASAANGKRRRAGKQAITADDVFHVGSITKSMTATMITRLIEKDILTLQTTIADVFADDLENIDTAWHEVTVHQFLTHTSGAPPNFGVATMFKRPPRGAERMAARKKTVLDTLAKPPKNTPGETFEYSNLGFTIAGTMAEKLTGSAWEDLMEKEVFEKLQLNSAGFGAPIGASSDDVPWGHQKLIVYKRSIKPGPDADNTPIMGPAGTVHMTLPDLATFGSFHLKLVQDSDNPSVLHTPVLDNYAMGWVVLPDREWANGKIVWHNGSNTLWYALLVLMPELNTVVAFGSNDGDIKTAEPMAYELIKLIGRNLQSDEQEDSNVE